MKTYARMNTFTVLTAVCAMAFATAEVVLFTGCATISPQAVRIYKQASMQTAQPRQEREIMTRADISALTRRGDAAFSRKDYAEAKELYYTVLLTDSDPDTDVLVSYGACLANLNRYQDAITVFFMALNKDPYNETANKNIAICRENIAAQEKRQREEYARQQAEYERQQREQEERNRQNWENTMALLTALSQTASVYSGGSSDYSGGGSSSGGQSQSGGSSSSEGSIASNPALAQRTYDNYARAAKGHYDNIINARNSGEPRSRINELENNLRNAQKQMSDYRIRAQQQGVTIRQDEYETKQP